MALATVTGSLKDVGLVSLGNRASELLFEPDLDVVTAGSGTLIPQEPIRVVPASDGSFSVDLHPSEETNPFTPYKLTINWQSWGVTRTVSPNWRIFVPTGGGAIASMIADVTPAKVITKGDKGDNGNVLQQAAIDALVAKDVTLVAADTALGVRIDSADTKNAAQDGRLTSIETKNTAQDGRLDGVEAKNATQDGRLTVNEAKNAEQDARLIDPLTGLSRALGNQSWLGDVVRVFLSPGSRVIGGITEKNRLRMYKGFEFSARDWINYSPSRRVSSTTIDPSRRRAENEIDQRGNVPQWILDRWKARMAGGTKTTVTVKPDGTGNYLTPKAANAAFTVSTGSTCEIVVYPGVYTDTEWTVKEGVTIRGTDRDKCILRGSNVDSATDAVIDNTSTLWLQKTARLENLTITMRNGRYPVHAEAFGGAPDARHDIVNCRLEHFGNDGAKAWRDANPGSGLLSSTVWASDRAWGYGSSSGIYQRFENVTFVSRIDGWYVHDNADFSKPINHDLINCRILTRSADGQILIQPLGSGHSSRVNINGSEVSVNRIRETDTGWATTLPNQPADRSQIKVTISGTTPIGFTTGARGKALKIESASTGTVSTVRVSGTGADRLFGVSTERDGGGGLKGYAFGQFDISGLLVGQLNNTTVNNTLGRRLGDLTAGSLTLTVTIDGGTPVSIVLNADYTAATNASILATINAALGSAGTASEYAVAQGENYASFPDRQVSATNTGATGIGRFQAVAKDAAGGVKIMGTASPVGDFLGIALEAIPPGKQGRILRSGTMQSTDQVPGIEGTSVAAGAAVYHSDTTAGAFATTGTRQAMTGYITGFARFNGGN
jgi:predicted RecA/RadA family phage recombinase